MSGFLIFRGAGSAQEVDRLTLERAIQLQEVLSQLYFGELLQQLAVQSQATRGEGRDLDDFIQDLKDLSAFPWENTAGDHFDELRAYLKSKGKLKKHGS